MDFITLRQFKDIDAKDKDENHLPNINYYEFFYRLAAGMAFYMIVWAVSIFQPKEVGYYVLHEPGQHGFLFLMMMVVYTSEIGRVKYVGTWYIADSMSIIGGFGYAGTNNGEQTWNRFTNINFLIFESSDSIRKSVILWNKYVQNWLNQYVYLNMVGTSLEPLKDIITNLISAFWHGFHAGYYLSFGGLTLHTQTSKLIFKKLTPYVKEKSGNDKTIMMIYNTILVIYTFFIVNYNFCPFFVMDFWASWAMLKQTYFSIHLLTLVIFIWLKFFPPRIHSQRDK
ncbi:O-acyltransferase domain containing protein [Entamoeba marina]